MTIKFQRNYRITIILGGTDKQIVIQPPLTIEFNINRSANAQLNNMDLRIYNLGRVLRNEIFQDFVSQNFNQIVVEAGYNQLSPIFVGNIFQAYTARVGNVNLVTSICARDGGFDTAATRSNFTLAAGASIKDVIATLAGDFPNLQLKSIGNIPGALQRPVSINGNTYEQIKKYSNNQCFIDNGQLSVLLGNEYLPSTFATIDASTGLLSVPRRTGQGYMSITTVFEPRIVMGQGINLKSVVLPQFNGQYKVVGVSHNGIISAAVDGACSTVIDLQSTQLFGGLQSV